ncbi:hypothetical protein AS889_15430 [Pseudomonas putida]|nr:hypothetical protein AS889_15430 [Pseudomonas putida]
MHQCQIHWRSQGLFRPRQFIGQSYNLTQRHAWISPVFKRHSTTVCQWVSIGAWLLSLQALPVEGPIEILSRLGGRTIGRQYYGVAA